MPQSRRNGGSSIPYCSLAKEIWWAVLNLFDCRWVFSLTLQGHYLAWHLGWGSRNRKLIWRSSFLAVVWIIWNECNNRCFEGKVSMKDSIVERIKFAVASWMSTLPCFRGTPLDYFTFKWKEILSSYGWCWAGCLFGLVLCFLVFVLCCCGCHGVFLLFL